jgi:hypothetical protein
MLLLPLAMSICIRLAGSRSRTKRRRERQLRGKATVKSSRAYLSIFSSSSQPIGKPTADLCYAINGAFLNRLGPDLVSAYSQASRAWHAFLYLESRGAAAAVAVAKRLASLLQQPVKRLKLEVSVAI